jgi:sulfate transport system permease protein
VFSGWSLGKFNFPGKKLLVTLIDLPLSISPIVSGLLFLILLGPRSTIGSFFDEHGIKLIFALPGLVLVTLFVTLPYISKELIPIMQQQGIEEEEVARLLGASGIKTFFYVTLPNIKWGLFYGALICMARALGEFGAVSVVSGHIRDKTNTVPLHVEILYNEYNFTEAFAVASTLTGMTLITLFFKNKLVKKIKE